MNWDEIGTITEIIGTVVIVITLFYVIKQIRLNSQQIEKAVQANRTTSIQSVSENFNTWREMVLEGNNSKIWIRGINNLHDLDETEKIKFNMIAGSFIWTCWFVYQLQRNEGLMGDANNSLYKDLYMHEGFREWLLQNEKLHSDDFQEYLMKVKKLVGNKRYSYGESSSLTAGVY